MLDCASCITQNKPVVWENARDLAVDFDPTSSAGYIEVLWRVVSRPWVVLPPPSREVGIAKSQRPGSCTGFPGYATILTSTYE